MCRMLARIAVRQFTPGYELLDAPHSLKHQSRCGRQPDAPDTCGPHASGCGIAWQNGPGLKIEKRGPDDRWDESFAKTVRALNTRAIIAHNRLASPGLKLDATLAHPFMDQFRGAPVAFCHNGGIHDLMDEAKAQEITDSQLFFRALCSSIASLEHSDVLAALKRLASQWRYTSLNGMLLTSGALHLWRCYDAEHPRSADFEKYYTLWLKRTDGDFCIASEPVDQSPDWLLMANRSLLTLTLQNEAVADTVSRF